MFHHAGTFGFFPFGLLGGLSGLLLLAGFVLLIVWVVRAMSGPQGSRWTGPVGPPPPQAGTPLDILGRRFASGEITADEYQKMRDVLLAPPKP